MSTLISQVTTPGTEIVTVARDGARMAKSGPYHLPIYCTAIYRAVARKRDGVLTWRRVGSLNDGTSGRGVTGPMDRRARAYAASTGRTYRCDVSHGVACE